MSKTCQVCNTSIPEDFINPLCLECYAKIDENNKKAKEEQLEEIKKSPNSPVNDKNIPEEEPIKDGKKAPELQNAIHSTKDNTFGIKDPNYKINPEKDDKDQILANLAQFIYSHNSDKGKKGKMLWYPTRNMYTYIKNHCIDIVQAHPQYPKHIWKPKIVDVGCGSGVGSNLMSQEADFVWGIDKNMWSIEFAKECFTRVKNGIYYNAQVTFDIIDIMDDNREKMKFDIVVAIEIIEHIHDTDKFLKSLIQFTKRDKHGNCKIEFPTEFHISTPNRNSKKIKKDQPENPYHVREVTSEEFYDLLSGYFEEVNLTETTGKPVERSCNDDIVFAHCKYPKF